MVVNGFILIEWILEGFQSVSEGKTIALLVAEAYRGFTVKIGKTKEKWLFLCLN